MIIPYKSSKNHLSIAQKKVLSKAFSADPGPAAPPSAVASAPAAPTSPVSPSPVSPVRVSAARLQWGCESTKVIRMLVLW